MASFNEHMGFEMEDAHAHSHLQKPFEPSSLYTTGNQSQRGLLIPEANFDDPMDFTMGEPHAKFFPQTSFKPPALHVNDSVIPAASRLAQDWTSFRQNNDFIQAKDNLPQS